MVTRSKQKTTFRTSSDLWVLAFLFFFIFISVFLFVSQLSYIYGPLGSSESQSSVSRAVVSYFPYCGVPGHISGEAVLKIQYHVVLTSLESVGLKANFSLGHSLILLLSLQAACHKERHVSQKAVSFIHDILTEVLMDWNEPSHFHFNEALFRPFERIMQLELCDEDVQDQAS